MLSSLAKNWWVLVIRGAAAIVFGLLAIFWPAITLEILVLFFGAFVLVDGVFTLVSAFRGGQGLQWLTIIEGLAGIAFGILTFLWPGTTAIVLLWFIAAWAIITGVLEVLAAIRLRRELEGEFWLGLAGVLSVIFGVIAFVFPGASALAIVVLIGIYAILFGVTLLVLAFRLRGHAGRAQLPGASASRA